MLKSKLFSGNARLKACETQDPAHVLEGDSGEHVRLIQAALAAVDGADIDAGERSAGRYGKSTSAAVLSYKSRRQIINHAYQKTADAIVGKMTIARLDADVEALENLDTKTRIVFSRPIAKLF
jgi:peptidoglycan hydrolase-like protein with peptidoglycan-binding domain